MLVIKIMNEQLKKELILMADEDQGVLQELHKSGELGTVEYHPKIRQIHERNTSRIKEIIKKTVGRVKTLLAHKVPTQHGILLNIRY